MFLKFQAKINAKKHRVIFFILQYNKKIKKLIYHQSTIKK
jgi:hypothetical protein